MAAEKGRVGERYILGNANLSLQEIYQLLADLSAVPKPRFRVPHWLPVTVETVDTGLSRLLGREPRIPVEAARLARYKMYFDASKARDELGLPQTPVEDALRRAVEWFMVNGYVGERRSR